MAFSKIDQQVSTPKREWLGLAFGDYGSICLGIWGKKGENKGFMVNGHLL